MKKQEAIEDINKLIDELQEILSEKNLKSNCIKKPYRKSLYSTEAARIIQIQGISSYLCNKFNVKEKDLK